MAEPVLLRGGVVYSPADPFATAMLVVDGRVAWVGSEGAADTAAGPGVRTLWLDGALVTPAFVDAHVHLTDTGLALTSLDLRQARSSRDVLDRVADAVRHRPGMLVLGHGWDETAWPVSQAPTRAEIDRAAGACRVYLSRVDSHGALVSSALVEAIGGADDLDGYHPSDPLRGPAAHRARLASREGLSESDRLVLQRRALQAAAAAGIGHVHEMAAPHIAGQADLALLLDWTRNAHDVPEVVPYWGEIHAVDTARRLGVRGCAGDLCIDGSIGSRTAALRSAYADADGTGTSYLSLADATEHVVACTDAGLQAGFHCIGDAAVALAIDAMEAAALRCGTDRLVAARHRLEHVEMIDQQQARVLARLGVVASVQPAFDAAWGGDHGMYADRLGEQRAAAMNPFADLARAGVTLAFGSDSPVTPFDPWSGVRAAALHHTPRQRMTVRGAFLAHTRGGWRAGRTDDAGVLAPGAVASYAVWDVGGDLVVQTPDERVAAWSTDPRSGVPGLPDLTSGAPTPVCRRTVVRGRVVYDADTPGG